jgi:hypothetical protein
VLEGHEDFVVDLGQDDHPAAAARARLQDPDPICLVRVGQPGKGELDPSLATGHRELGPVSLRVEHVTRRGDGVGPIEGRPGEPNAHRDTGSQLGIAASDPLGLREGTGDLLGDDAGGIVDVILIRIGPVDGHEGGVAELGRQPVRRIGLERGGRGRSGGGPDHRLLLIRVPTTDLNLADLLGRRHPGPECLEVEAEHQLKRIRRCEVSRLGCLGGLGRPAELELPIDHGELETDLPGPPLQELPVAQVDLRHIPVGHGSVVDLPQLQPRSLGHPSNDVRVGDVSKRVRDPTAMKAVGRIVAPNGGVAPRRVELRLDRRDLARDQWLAGLFTQWRGEHPDPGADPDACLLEDISARIAEPELEHVREVQIVVDHRTLQTQIELVPQEAPVDFHPRLGRVLVRHRVRLGTNRRLARGRDDKRGSGAKPRGVGDPVEQSQAPP